MITIESFHYADRGTQNNVSERNEVFETIAIYARYSILCKGIFVLLINYWVLMSFLLLGNITIDQNNLLPT